MRERRGHYLEAQIQKVFDYLNSAGIHAHKNHAARTVEGVYLAGEPFDYEIFTSPVHVFDAKEAKTGRWPLSNAKPSQMKALLDCSAHGAEAYFLVLFHGHALRRFDVGYVRQAIVDGRKALEENEGLEWDYRTFLKG